VAESPRAVEATTCPRCGAPVAPEQEWCVECGTAARMRIVPPPNWRWPVALVAALVALVGAGVAVALVDAMSKSPGPLRPATTAAASAPAPAAAAPPAASTTGPAGGASASGTPGSGVAGSGVAGSGVAGSGVAGSGAAGNGAAGKGTAGRGAATGGAAGSGATASGTAGTGTPATAAKLLTWPKGVAAYTVVLLSTPDRNTARTTARGLATAGLAGLARSADFVGLPAGSWLVFTGSYKSKQEAKAAAAAAKRHGAPAATVEYLKPKR
jgi:hypothetical protein